MAAFDSDKVIKGLAPAEVKAIKEWRKDFCKPFDKAEVAKLIELSEAVDALWKQVISEAGEPSKNQPADPGLGTGAAGRANLEYPRPGKGRGGTGTVLHGLPAAQAGDGLRCALWFWPIPDTAKLPSRDVFLFDMELILKGTIQTPQPDAVLGQLFPGEPVNPEHVAFVGHFGIVNVDDLLKKNERLRIVDQVAQKIRFHHWELRFAELFADRGGFDLIVGNPPWVLVSFDEAGVLSDQDPLIAIRQMSATEAGKVRDSLLTRQEALPAYLNESVVQTGTQEFLGSIGMFPHLQGMKANLYKCFITRSWQIGAASFEIVGFLLPPQ